MGFFKDEMIERRRDNQERFKNKYPERVKEISARSRAKNKHKLLAPQLCYCGLTITHNNIRRHERSQKHFKNVCLKYEK